MWRRAYEAIPQETIREFPWHGASNLVVPVIAIHSDTLLARVMAAVFKTSPLWVVKAVGKFPKDAAKAKDAFEEYLNYVGIEPEELDLYRVYHEWCGEAIRYGTSVVKCPWFVNKIDVPIGDGMGKLSEYTTDVMYEGPRPEKLPFNDFLMSPIYKTVESADFKAHRIRYYSRQALEEMAWRGIYDKEKVKEIIGKPDRTSPDSVMQVQQSDAGTSVSAGDDYEEYYVYECHFKYRVNRGRFVKVIAWYNEFNNKLLRAYYNYYPSEIFLAARLFYRDDYFYGYGFAETLGMFQEEISQEHNQRRDNMTVANTMMWRVKPDSLYNKGYRIFPGAALHGEEGDIEGLQAGQVSPMTIDEERLSLELAEKRSGVSGPMHGSGSGTMSKRGVYSSMGTLALLQEGNTRTDLNITDIRYAHIKLGRVVVNQRAEFGTGDLRRFGENAPLIKAALEGIKNKMLNLPVYSATASVNREVEKQSDLMLTGVMQKHYAMITQMLQAANNQFSQPAERKYLADAVQAANTLMQAVFKHFGYDEVERFVPEVEEPAPPAQSGTPASPSGQPQGGPPVVAGGPPQGAAPQNMGQGVPLAMMAGGGA
jgi:hypothetical protein